MPTTDPPALHVGDRVVFRSALTDPEHYAQTLPGGTPPPPLVRTGTVLAEPRGLWVQVQYDDEAGPALALVETLTREPEDAS